jgi:HKD family nuclease
VAVEMQLVTNTSARNHLEAILKVLDAATHISFAVAFLKQKGLGQITHILEARLKAGAIIEAFIGRDFFLTEPTALETLLKMSKRCSSLQVFVAKRDTDSTFHPKIYLGLRKEGGRVLVGSANLTGGALSKNDEISILSYLRPQDLLLGQIKTVFADYRSNGRFEELDQILLEQYRSQFNAADRARRLVEKEFLSNVDGMFDLNLLELFYEQFQNDKHEMRQLKKRRRDRAAAHSAQQKISKLHELQRLSRQDINAFTNLFKDLITSADGHKHLWHSGDIHRRGQKALEQPADTIALFALAETAVKLPVEEGYGSLRDAASHISGVGINMVTEILCTFAPKRYAVFNGNTAAALRAIGAEPPKSVTLISPDAYSRVCATIDAVRKRTGGEDFTDADAFLNWVYYAKVKQ